MLPGSLFPGLYFLGRPWCEHSSQGDRFSIIIYLICMQNVSEPSVQCHHQSSEGLGRWNSKVLYSSGYYPDILLGENWPGRLSLKPPDSVICETWTPSSSPSLNALMSFKHPALLELPRKVFSHFKETASSVKWRGSSGDGYCTTHPLRCYMLLYQETSSWLYVTLWKEKKNCQSSTFRNTHLVSCMIWAKFPVACLDFYMLQCWHGRFEPLLSWRHPPHTHLPGELLRQGVNHSWMVYAASIITNFIPLSKVLRQQQLSFTWFVFRMLHNATHLQNLMLN